MEFPKPGRDTPFCSFASSERALLESYAMAFETADIDALAGVLAENVTWEMPPAPVWFAGRHDVAEFVGARMRDHGCLRTIPTAANGQPAFALYARHDGLYRAHALHVLTLTSAGISKIVSFSDSRLFPLFGMEPTVT